MWKKLFIVGVIAAVGVGVFGGTKLVRHIKSEIAEAREWAESQIPVEKQIDQLKKDVNSLDKDINNVKDELAKQIVECRELTNKTADLRSSLDVEQKTLVQRGEAVKDSTERVKYGSTMIPVAEAKSRLQRDVTIHVRKKQTLDSMEKALASRERIKESLEKQLDGMIKQKQELRVEIEAIEADYKDLQLKQIESKYQTDDTRLARIKEQIRKLKKGAEIESERLNLTQNTAEDKPVSGESPTQSVDDILAPITKASK